MNLVKENLYFATQNQGKFEECAAYLSSLPKLHLLQLPLSLMEPQELDSLRLSQQKLAQAEQQAHHQNLREGWLLIDDTALCIDHLNGLPGTLVKSFIERIGADGLSRLTLGTENQAQAPNHSFVKTARAVCVLGLSKLSTGEKFFFQGEVAGKIVLAQGSLGFGWDQIFKPIESQQTFGEMPTKQKNTLSHRAKALYHLANFFRLAPLSTE